MSGDTTNDAPQRNWKATVTPYLTNIAQASTPFLSTFILIHLAAPIMANVGGSSLASQVMVCTVVTDA